MNENQENKKVEFLVHYKKIYSILRDEWDMNKTGMLKQILKNFISACNTDDQENIKNEIWACWICDGWQCSS